MKAENPYFLPVYIFNWYVERLPPHFLLKINEHAFFLFLDTICWKLNALKTAVVKPGSSTETETLNNSDNLVALARISIKDFCWLFFLN